MFEDNLASISNALLDCRPDKDPKVLIEVLEEISKSFKSPKLCHSGNSWLHLLHLERNQDRRVKFE